MGHSEIGPHLSQVFASLRKVIFMDSRLLIFVSMSAIFASARLRTSVLFAFGDTRSDNSPRISASENPSS